MTDSPWNKDRYVGHRTAFTHADCRLLDELLSRRRDWRDLALMRVGIDSLLRAIDLVQLRVRDVRSGGKIVSELRIRQKKTKRGAVPVLTPGTRKVLAIWIDHARLRSGDFLFPGEQHGQHLSTTTLRRLVKNWATQLGLDPQHYSAHSLRRTKPLIMHQQGYDIVKIMTLLGHASLEPTTHYLHTLVTEAQSAALALIQNTNLGARDIVERSLAIAADICVYTNQNIVVEELDADAS